MAIQLVEHARNAALAPRAASVRYLGTIWATRSCKASDWSSPVTLLGRLPAPRFMCSATALLLRAAT